MPHPLALAALAGIASSGLYLSLISGIPGIILFAYFVQLPVVLVGLTLGLAGSLVAALGALLVTGVIAGVLAAVLYVAVQAGPALIVVRQALLSRDVDGATEWFPPGLLLGQLTLGAGLAIFAAFVIFASEPDGLAGVVESFLAVALSEVGMIPPDTALPPELHGLARLFPGLMASSWLLMTVLNGVLAQNVAERLGRNLRPTPTYSALELPPWLWIGAASAALLSLFGGSLGFLGGALLMTLAVPYFFLGLAVAHHVSRRWTHRRVLLAVLYAALILLGWPALLVVLLGLVEDWVNFRQRLT